MTKSEIETLQNRILGAMKAIRNVPRELIPGPSGVAKGAEIWEGNLDGESADRLIIYLRSSGCTWAIRKGNVKDFNPGCLDCEHSVADTTYGTPISSEDYLKQFLQKFRNHESRSCPILCLYNEGSFFNEDELPPDARRQILKHVAASGHVKRIIIESLPNYVTESILVETVNLLKNIEVEVGIGLESSNETVRKLCVNKPYTLKEYERAAHLVRKHCRLLSYVMLKPVFLSEKEAIEDTIATISYAFDVGADAVSIEPVSIGTYTMSGFLFRLGKYKPTWLRSVLECARFAAKHGEVRIGGYQFAPNYRYYAVNCKLCTNQVKSKIRLFNATHNVADIENMPISCCIESWKAELATEYLPLALRISAQLDEVELLLRNQNIHSILEDRR